MRGGAAKPTAGHKLPAAPPRLMPAARARKQGWGGGVLSIIKISGLRAGGSTAGGRGGGIAVLETGWD